MYKDTIYAAGAVLYRYGLSGIEVAVVHRPEYDDWSIPKGKCDKGETIVETTIREIKEETGFSIKLTQFVKRIHYYVPEHNKETSRSSKKNKTPNKPSRSKYVYYWAAEVIGGEFKPNSEVDEIRWLNLNAASLLLSYSLDKNVLRTFSNLKKSSSTVMLVRHAWAGDPKKFKGLDKDRPLDTKGKKQAKSLVKWLSAFGVNDIISAPNVRCTKTVEPYSIASKVKIVTDSSLSDDDWNRDSKKSFKEVIKLVNSHASEKNALSLCSQGDAIDQLLAKWAEESSFKIDKIEAKKGSIWIINTDETNRMVNVYYVSNPLAVMVK